MWYIYILHSKNIDRFYVGVTENMDLRLIRHNAGWGKYTKRGIPWTVAYHEIFQSKTEALKREQIIKRKKSRKYIEQLING